MDKTKKGILCAIVTVAFWSFTMIWSKILLDECFEPFTLLIVRFGLAYLALWALCPRMMKFSGWRNEAPYILCGLFGVTLCFLAEYQALTYTFTSVVSTLVATNPFMTALLMWVIYREKPRNLFFAGLLLSFAGAVLVNMSSTTAAPISIPGIALSLLDALLWGAYNVAMRKTGASVDGEKPNMIQVTRRVFFWGLVTMLPLLPVFGFHLDASALATPTVLASLACSAFLASALGYVTWNIAIENIGPLKTSAFALCRAALTLILAAIILGDPISPTAVIGVALVIGGLAVAQRS